MVVHVQRSMFKEGTGHVNYSSNSFPASFWQLCLCCTSPLKGWLKKCTVLHKARILPRNAWQLHRSSTYAHICGACCTELSIAIATLRRAQASTWIGFWGAVVTLGHLRVSPKVNVRLCVSLRQSWGSTEQHPLEQERCVSNAIGPLAFHALKIGSCNSLHGGYQKHDIVSGLFLEIY